MVPGSGNHVGQPGGSPRDRELDRRVHGQRVERETVGEAPVKEVQKLSQGRKQVRDKEIKKIRGKR